MIASAPAWPSHSAAAREPLVGVSLKMFLGYAESLRYVAGVASAAPGFAGVGVFVLPSFPVIAEAAGALARDCRRLRRAGRALGAVGCVHGVRLALAAA